MAKTFHLTVARVGENLFDGEAVSITLPGAEGAFQVLAHHEPTVAQLKPGVVRIEAADGTRKELTVVDSGIAEISGNQATVIL